MNEIKLSKKAKTYKPMNKISHKKIEGILDVYIGRSVSKTNRYLPILYLLLDYLI